MNMQSFSENHESMDKLLQNPLPWLQDKGNTEKQKEYLNLRIFIQLFERFEFVKDDEFEEYKLLLTN